MFRKRFLVAFGASCVVLLISVLIVLGRAPRGADLIFERYTQILRYSYDRYESPARVWGDVTDLISWATQITRDRHGPDGAPLLACDNADAIAEGYFVFLNRGYSLEQHKENIGMDLSSSIDHVYPETSRYGLYYFAKLDDATLAVVRRDVRVKFLECNLKVSIASMPSVGDL